MPIAQWAKRLSPRPTRPSTQQPFQCFNAYVAPPVTEFSQRRSHKRNLAKWRQPLVDEPLKPSQRRAFVASHVCPRQQLAQRERVGERQAAHPSQSAGGRAAIRRRAEASVAARPEDHTVKREEECGESDSRDEQPLLHVSILRGRDSAVGTVCTPLHTCLHVDGASRT
jgi:hypothetical protein